MMSHGGEWIKDNYGEKYELKACTIYESSVKQKFLKVPKKLKKF